MTDNNTVFEKYFSRDNLRLAWERVIRSNGKDIKDFFGIEIMSVDLDNNLEKLSDLIIHGNYKPQRPFKYYEPKPSKTHRTKTILYIEDALIYQAIADSVASLNYKKLSDNNLSVFGSVLHPEVEKGVNLLDEKDPDFYFFEYYIPLYNKFINSINNEISNDQIRFKLETDITGFFDAIPHSKLMMILYKFGLEAEIVDFLSKCLDVWSGTKDSVTPGVGIPQGSAASFFLANVFLNDLDYLICQRGYTYYRYMDDIMIYEETEAKLTEVLVLIDNFLKGRGLSLNTKKTSIQEIVDREAEKLPFLPTYGDIKGEYENKNFLNNESQKLYIDDQRADNEQGKKFIIRTIEGAELIAFCRKEIKDVESILLNRFDDIFKLIFNPRVLANDDKLRKDIVHLAYRWRNSNSILNTIDKPILNEELIEIWLFCVEHFFWKANHFCWNLNQYGSNEKIAQRLKQLLNGFESFEWVRYQILSNMSTVQCFKSSELKSIFRKTKLESSGLVRLGYYMILIKHLKPDDQLFAALRQAIKDDNEPYIRNYLAGILPRRSNKKFDEIKFWFGL